MSSQPDTAAGVPSALLLPLQLLPMGPNYGALLVGTFLSLILYGVELHQVYRYIRLYGRDHVFLKCYVGFLFILDTFHTTICVHSIYWYLVVNYFDPIKLETPVWSLNLQGCTMAAVIVTCQTFYARRVYLLDRRLRPLVAVLAAVQPSPLKGQPLDLTSIMSDQSRCFPVRFILGNLTTLRQLTWLQSAGLGLVITVDVASTSVLTASLHRSRTGFKGTDNMIDVLIAYALYTGFLTNFAAIACLSLDRAAPGKMLFIAADTIYAKG
ncbi:uncharacterized protein TRAVEDRAFT_48943 [Trametes versicolor FP-101664 SS1]|uniref:uncharacterized protein n=1 Tax=Trametes versicolor (strain FP-101664) TaxID=717944 RepID=UPI0004623C47|nr:uncharacterized protein TRAVEDRAFT_48943 [Trametes versicolor FP-101664 SS1]EIW57920.1 hypothetical protein TRAVEDRAFT_48943 [Trametes versicolor FP-101664 SS1]